MRALVSLGVASAVLALPTADLLAGAGLRVAVPAPVVARETGQDTVLAVRPGDVFDSETLRGTLIVREGGDRIRLSGEADEAPLLVREGSRVRLRPRRGAEDTEVVVELPRWMPISIRSRELDVSVRDREAGVRIEILSGDIRLEEVLGSVEVRTLHGEVETTRTQGSMGVFTADGDVRVVGHRGRLQVESTDGELTLRGIEGPASSASTLDGDVEFEGSVSENGTLDLSTHDGDVTVGLPASVQAEVEVSTFHGAFSSEFRVRTGGFRAGEPLRFRIGDGGARVSLRSFDGDIRILSR